MVFPGLSLDMKATVSFPSLSLSGDVDIGYDFLKDLLLQDKLLELYASDPNFLGSLKKKLLWTVVGVVHRVLGK